MHFFNHMRFSESN